MAFSLISSGGGRLLLIMNRNVKALVGEVDFSFHAISTASSSDESLDMLIGRKGKND